MPIKKLSPACRVTEAATAVREIIDAYESQPDLAGDSTLSEIIIELRSTLLDLTQLLNYTKKASELAAKNLVRNEAVRNFATSLDGYCALPIQEVKVAGEAVRLVFAQFGLAMMHESYAVESALMHSLLQKLEEPEIVANIKKLMGLEELVRLLKDAQHDFDKTLVEYEEAIIIEKEHGTATSLKGEIIPVVNVKLVPYVVLKAAMNSQKFSHFAGHVEKTINKINDAVKRRGGSDPIDPEHEPK